MISTTKKHFFFKKNENRHRGSKNFPDKTCCFVVLSVGGSMHNLLSNMTVSHLTPSESARVFFSFFCTL